MARIGPLQVQTLEGLPTTIGQVTLIPQAQLVALGRRQGRVTQRGFGGRGWVWGLLIPRALIERRGDRTQRVVIPDRTGQVLLIMAIVGLGVALLSILMQMLIQPFATETEED